MSRRGPKITGVFLFLGALALPVTADEQYWSIYCDPPAAETQAMVAQGSFQSIWWRSEGGSYHSDSATYYCPLAQGCEFREEYAYPGSAVIVGHDIVDSSPECCTAYHLNLFCS